MRRESVYAVTEFETKLLIDGQLVPSVEGICSGLAEVRELLGPPGAVERAADAIAAHLLAGESNAN